MIDEYISKIERIRGYNDKSIRDFFEPSEVARIKAVYFMIKQLVSKYEEKEVPKKEIIKDDLCNIM